MPTSRRWCRRISATCSAFLPSAPPTQCSTSEAAEIAYAGPRRRTVGRLMVEWKASIPHPMQSLCALQTPRHRDACNTRYRAARYTLPGRDFHPLDHASLPGAQCPDPLIEIFFQSLRVRLRLSASRHGDSGAIDEGHGQNGNRSHLLVNLGIYPQKKAVPMRVVLALIATLAAMPGSVFADNPYAAAGISNPDHVAHVLARLQQAVAADDRATVAEMVN
jgi:hypothetical protein